VKRAQRTDDELLFGRGIASAEGARPKPPCIRTRCGGTTRFVGAGMVHVKTDEREIPDTSEIQKNDMLCQGVK
jgi:hypothetical protein